MGITFVSVGGYGGYLPFLRLTTRFRIPWVIFSDGEPNAIDAVNNSLQQVGESDVAANTRCVVLPKAQCFEEYLITADSLDVVREMIADFTIESAGVTEPRGLAGIKHSWSVKTREELLDEVLTNKTAYGTRIASAFAKLPSQEQQTPETLRVAFDIALPVEEHTTDVEDDDDV